MKIKVEIHPRSKVGSNWYCSYRRMSYCRQWILIKSANKSGKNENKSGKNENKSGKMKIKVEINPRSKVGSNWYCSYRRMSYCRQWILIKSANKSEKNENKSE
jgi:hypothetical protein